MSPCPLEKPAIFLLTQIVISVRSYDISRNLILVRHGGRRIRDPFRLDKEANGRISKKPAKMHRTRVFLFGGKAVQMLLDKGKAEPAEPNIVGKCRGRPKNGRMFRGVLFVPSLTGCNTEGSVCESLAIPNEMTGV
jgi:hypothetical protein